MTNYRPSSVANAFYPGTEQAIINELAQYLNPDHGQKPPKAMIVPHAGWRYSGACAGRAYSKWFGRGQDIKRVIMFGPAHRVGFAGVATTSADYWSSPAGAYKIEQETLGKLCHGQQYINQLDEAHAEEHCLEVQLPFIQACFPNAQLMPFLLSQGGFEIGRPLLNILWGGEETVIIISSDLSHYTPPAVCRQFDDETASLIEQNQLDKLDGKRACGFQGIQSLLALKDEKGLQIERTHICHSGDAIPSDKVVGYGAWVLH